MRESIRQYGKRVDRLYLLLCGASSALSVLVLLSVGQNQLDGDRGKAAIQLIASILGMLLAVAVSTFDYRELARAWPAHALLSWGLVLPTLFLHNVQVGFVTVGYDAGGTSNYSWYRIGPLTFQPSELAKISFILTFAWHLSRVRAHINRPLALLGLLAHMAAPVLILHLQGDDGTALMFFGIGFLMLFAGGVSLWLVGACALAAVGGGAALLLFKPNLLKSYQFRRILAVLRPEDPELADFVYQQKKGSMAIGTGGVFGRGLFSGDTIYVPNAWNDFFFAYLAHVLGFVGATAVLTLLLAICLRTLRAARRSADFLGCSICTGVFAVVFLQSVVNVGMNLQVLPVIGITLPFFSAGGSSVVMLYLCAGLVLSVGMRAQRA